MTIYNFIIKLVINELVRLSERLRINFKKGNHHRIKIQPFYTVEKKASAHRRPAQRQIGGSQILRLRSVFSRRFQKTHQRIELQS